MILLTTLLLTLLISLTTARTCYHPDKSIAASNVPCTSDSTSFCCDSGAICMTNGYCIGVGSQPYLLFRGACTDQDWGDDCPSHCGNSFPPHSFFPSFLYLHLSPCFILILIMNNSKQEPHRRRPHHRHRLRQLRQRSILLWIPSQE